MLDNIGIYNRYESCYNASSSGELARILGIARQTTNDWKNGKSKVPWWRLKELVDTHGINWDWLLTGKGEKLGKVRQSDASEGFNIKEINRRYLSQFPKNLTQADLAKLNEVSQVTIYKWVHGIEQVSWKKLSTAVKDEVTWEWLLKGD